MSALIRFFNALLPCLLCACWAFASDGDGENILERHQIFDAIERRDPSELSLCISRDDWQGALNEDMQTALYYAVMLGYEDIVELLLKNGANPNESIHFSLRKGSSSRIYREMNPFLFLIQNRKPQASNTAIFDMLLKHGKLSDSDIRTYIEQIKFNLHIVNEPLKTSRHSRSSSMALIDSWRQSMPVPECYLVANFSRSQFDYLRTHIGSESFDKCKTTWHIYGDARVFSLLVRQTLELDKSDVTKAAIMEILWHPKPWLFPGEFPRPIILAEIVNELEPILDGPSLLRFLFVVQQALLDDYEPQVKSSLRGASSSSLYREAITMQSALDCLAKYKGKPHELAAMLAIQDNRNFLAISPLEFFRHVLGIEHSAAYAGNIRFGDGLKNLVSASIVSSVKDLNKTKRARRKCDFWLNVAKSLIELNDYFGASNILPGIDSVEVTRLKIVPDDKDLHTSLGDILSNKNRYRKYRETCKSLRGAKIPFIPIGGPEANDISGVGELGDEEKSISGIKRFNVNKNDGLFELLTDHEQNYQWLRQQSPVSGVQIDWDLSKAIDNFREEFAQLLSYSRKRFGADLDAEILPLWDGMDFIQWGSDSSKLSKITQHAISNDLADGLKIFHAYVEWKFASRTPTTSRGSSRSSSWRNALFKELEAHFSGDIIESIKRFTKDGSGDIMSIGKPLEPSSSSSSSDLANQESLAEKRWIIYLVKRDLVEEWFILKSAKVKDVYSFIQWFKQFVDASTSLIDDAQLDRVLAHLGIIGCSKKVKLKSIYDELTSQAKE